MKHPTPHVPRLSALWFLERPNYIRYMLRELTSIWIGAYAVVLTIGLLRLSQGAVEWEQFRQSLGSAPGIAFQAVALLFALYHTISWFSLAPSTMPLWRGETQVPTGWVKLAHYLVWMAVSAMIFLIVGE